MLTNDDVKKLKGVMKGVVEDAIDGRTPGIVRKIVNEAIETKTPPIVDAIVEKHLKPVKKDIRKIKKDLTTVIDFFDRGQMRLEKRVERIEEHLDFTPSVAIN